MSLYSVKQAGSQAGQPWQGTWTPGASMSNLFGMYPSLGNFVSAGPISIQTTLDGPIQVVRYGSFTLNHALTVTNRCRGLMILCDSFTGGAGGSISMTARGAAGQTWWPWYDLTIPNSIAVTANGWTMNTIQAWFAANGYFIGDPVIWSQINQFGGFPGLQGVTAATITPGTKILDSTQCGAIRLAGSCSTGQYASANGNIGNAGAKGTGSGGSGPVINRGSVGGWGVNGARGCPWGGGPGGGGVDAYGFSPDAASTYPPGAYGGQGGYGEIGGGGAGNPGGAGAAGPADSAASGTGGILSVIVRAGGISVASGFQATCNGSNGGSSLTTLNPYFCGGSGSGGGFQAWIRGTGTSSTQSGTRQCAGGNGGNGGSPYNVPGASGGAGAILDLQFSDLGF